MRYELWVMSYELVGLTTEISETWLVPSAKPARLIDFPVVLRCFAQKCAKSARFVLAQAQPSQSNSLLLCAG
ncbi:MAG: hypothetical protein ACOCQG_05665 [Candidatus Nanoarchaeia archaeon]